VLLLHAVGSYADTGGGCLLGQASAWVHASRPLKSCAMTLGCVPHKNTINTHIAALPSVIWSASLKVGARSESAAPASPLGEPIVQSAKRLQAIDPTQLIFWREISANRPPARISYCFDSAFSWREIRQSFSARNPPERSRKIGFVTGSPDKMAPVVRTAPDGVLELTMMRWGFRHHLEPLPNP